MYTACEFVAYCVCCGKYWQGCATSNCVTWVYNIRYWCVDTIADCNILKLFHNLFIAFNGLEYEAKTIILYITCKIAGII